MFGGTNLTLISDVDQVNRCLVCMKDPLPIDVSSPSTYKSRYKKDEFFVSFIFCTFPVVVTIKQRNRGHSPHTISFIPDCIGNGVPLCLRKKRKVTHIAGTNG